jgi:integrase
MPRTPQVRYFDSRKAYFTTYKGRQIPLAVGPKDEPDGPTYKAAVRKFGEVMQVGEAARAEDDNLVITVLDQYAVHLRNQNRLKTLDILLRCTKSAVAEFGGLKVKDLKPLHVQAWLDKMGTNRGLHRGRVRQWGDTMKRMAYDKLMAALNWAVKQKMITRNPVERGAVELRKRAGRGRDYVLLPGEHEKIVAASKENFADLLTFLSETGCRPGEAYNATASHYDRELGAIVYRWDTTEGYLHKTAQKTEKDRVINLTPALVTLIERLIGRHPTGYLFRNRDGEQWTNSAFFLMLKRRRNKLGLKGKMIAYSYRHTFATNWLLRGGSIKILAELMGNSVAMIEKYYGHLDADRATVRRRFLEFMAGERTRSPGENASAGDAAARPA